MATFMFFGLNLTQLAIYAGAVLTAVVLAVVVVLVARAAMLRRSYQRARLERTDTVREGLEARRQMAEVRSETITRLSRLVRETRND
jgi:uncharacterized membrane protein